MQMIVLDANVLVSALGSGGGASREVLCRVPQGHATPPERQQVVQRWRMRIAG